MSFAFLINGRKAASIRKAAAELLVRYLGGDLSLIREVTLNHEAQQDLAAIPEELRTPEEAHHRLFGEAVEQAPQGWNAGSNGNVLIEPSPNILAARQPSRLEIRPKPDGVQAATCKMHCYVSLVQGTDTVDEQGRRLIKIGCGDDPMLRSEAAHTEVKKYQKDWHFSLFRIFQEVGQAMETLMHRKFRTPPFGKKYNHPGFREYFWVHPDAYVQLVDEAFEQCIPELLQQQFQAKKDAEATLQATPSRLHDLQYRREEAEFEADMADRALLRQRAELELESYRIELESRRKRAEIELEDAIEESRLKRRKLEAEGRVQEARAETEIRRLCS